jgi:hypothetical protein
MSENELKNLITELKKGQEEIKNELKKLKKKKSFFGLDSDTILYICFFAFMIAMVIFD